MSKAKTILKSFLMLGMICTACDNKVVETVKTLSVSESAMDFPSSGGDKSFVVESNTNWSVDHNASSWLTATPDRGSDKGTVVVTTTANTGTVSRTAIITISSTGLPNKTISVTQVGATPTLTVSVSSLSFASTAENKTFEITSNINWSIGSSESWLTVSPTTGANNSPVSVSATENTGTTQRTATITVSGTGETSQTISVTQAGASTTLTLSTTSLSFSSASGQQSFSITSNADWSVACNQSWLTVSPTSGANNGTITVTATENTDITQRTATITVVGTGVMTQTISVTQEGTLPSLALSTTSLSFTSEAGQQSFNITSNTNWTIAHDAPTWLTVSPSSGANNGSVTINATANTDATQRTATITVSGSGVTSQIINVTQPGATETPTLTVSATSLSFSSTAENKTFDITSNINWIVSSSETWLTVAPATGSNNGTVTVNAATNTGTSQRTATITVSGEGVTSQTIKVTQAGETPTLTVSQYSLSFTSASQQKTFNINSNTDWIVNSSETWLTVLPATGTNNGTVTVTTSDNLSTTQRTAIITVSATGVTPQTVNIMQAGETLHLDLSTTIMNFTSISQTNTFTITSNTNWTVSSNALSWLTVEPTSGANGGLVTVSVSTNTGVSPRTGILAVSGTGVTAQTINVTQYAPAPILELSTTALFFSSFGEQKTFNISSNINWTVDYTESWLSVSPVSGSNDGSFTNQTVTVTAAAYTNTTQSRTATITVHGSDLIQTINVIQYKAPSDIFANFTETTNNLNLGMIAVQGGAYTMGSNDVPLSCTGTTFHSPAHNVTINDFYIGKYEVTQAQWKAIMGNNPSVFNGDNLPVENVNWNDVQTFINKLNELSGMQYRLPTEAEWEFAARGGVYKSPFMYSGGNSLSYVAWYNENSGNRTHAVGTKQPNVLGIYDMSGNVWEWCSDWYEHYNYSSQINPIGPLTGSARVQRGGGYGSLECLKVWDRDRGIPDSQGNGLGFRLACSVK